MDLLWRGKDSKSLLALRLSVVESRRSILRLFGNYSRPGASNKRDRIKPFAWASLALPVSTSPLDPCIVLVFNFRTRGPLQHEFVSMCNSFLVPGQNSLFGALLF